MSPTSAPRAAFVNLLSTFPRRQRASFYASATRPRYPPSQKSSSSAASRTSFRLSPSDFAFLWTECKRCFYLKAHGKLYRPRAPFPTIFGTIDMAMKRHFQGLRTTDLLPDMPPGTFLCEERDAWVESRPITLPNYDASVYIRGMVRNIYCTDTRRRHRPSFRCCLAYAPSI